MGSSSPSSPVRPPPPRSPATTAARATRDDKAAPAPAEDAPSEQQPQHGRALRQLEAVERALHAHIALPRGVPLRLSLDTALGRVPFAGFAAHLAVGAYTLATAQRYGAGGALLARIAANVLLDNSLRAVPLIGSTLAPLVTGGGNRRNLALLRAHLEAQQQREQQAAARKTAAGAGAANAGWRLAASAFRALTWPVRRLSGWTLLAAVVAVPLGVGAGVVGFAAWSVLRALGFV